MREGAVVTDLTKYAEWRVRQESGHDLPVAVGYGHASFRDAESQTRRSCVVSDEVDGHVPENVSLLPGGFIAGREQPSLLGRHLKGVLSFERAPMQEAVGEASRAGIVVDLFQRTEQGERRRFTKGWLLDEVTREKAKLIENPEDRWFELAGTGFWVGAQTRLLFKHLPTAGNDVPQDILERELAKIGVDIKEFQREFLDRIVSIRYDLAWTDTPEGRRISCPRYGNALWESVTLKKERDPQCERDNVCYITLFGDPDTEKEGVEHKLRSAPPNTYVILGSPAGWSGLVDANGDAITFKETQITVIRTKEDGNLEAYTLRCDASLAQCEEFQRRLGLGVVPAKDERTRIKNAVANVAFLEPSAERIVNSFDDVIDILQESVGSRDEDKRFDEMRELIHAAGMIQSEHDPFADELITIALEVLREEFAEDHASEERILQVKLALAIPVLHLFDLYQEKKPDASRKQGDQAVESVTIPAQRGRALAGFAIPVPPIIDYRQKKKNLEQLSGCSGGGGEVRINSMGTSRAGEVESSSSGGIGEKRTLTCTCPVCDQEVEAIIKNNTINCPSCNSSAPYEC